MSTNSDRTNCLSVDRSQPRQYGDEQGRYFSVSQICEVVAGENPFYAPGSDVRGHDLHAIFALMVGESMGWCDGPDVPQEYQGYANAIMRWIAQAKPQPMRLEQTLRHKTLPYAGTMDFVGMIGADYGVLDLKTGAKARWHSLQLHAYKHLLDRASKMWILYVDSDGSFEQVAIKNNLRDWVAFQTGISVLHWREG